jgi:outer membrane receptor protein involved in Fe transport
MDIRGKRKSWWIGLPAAWLIAVAVAPAAQAEAQQQGQQGQQQGQQQQDPEVVLLRELIVTVRKVDERAQDVPLSLTVLNSQRILRDRLQHTEDLARLVPGFTFDRGAFPNDTRPAMRGIQSERGRPSVAVLIDGHDLSTANLAVPGGSAALNLALHDLERIEVVKGPQSTLFGRNAFAGAVNYITAAPSFAYSGRTAVELGEFGSRQYTLSLTGPIISDKLAFRLNAVKSNGDGFFSNPVTSSPLGANDATGIALGLLYQPNGNFSVSGRYQYMNRDESDAASALVASNVRLPLPGTTQDRASYEGPIRASIQDVGLSPDPFTGKPMAGQDMTYHIATWKADWWTGMGTVTYLGSLIQNDSRIRQDGDFTDFPVNNPMAFALSSLTSFDYDTEQQNHEVRWTHQGERSNWIVGAQRLTENAGMLNESQFWLRNPNSLLRGPPFFLATAPKADLQYPVETRRDTRHLGLFAGYGRELTDRTRVSLEARYNNEDVDYSNSGWKLEAVTLFSRRPDCDPSRPQGTVLAPGVVNGCAQTAKHSSSQITPRATLEYSFSDDAMGYVSFARGYKPGGYETLEVDNFDGRQFRPEHLNAYEIGFKSTWLMDRLILNGAAFYNDYTDQQISHQQIDPTTGFLVPRMGNAGGVRVQGFELGTDWRTGNGLSASLSYGFTDAIFQEFILGPAAPPAGLSQAAFEAVFAACGVPVGQTSTPLARVEAGNECADFSGNQVGRSPRHAVNGLVLYRQPLLATGNYWFAQASSMYRSRRYLDESNRAWLPGYGLTDLQVGIEGRRWAVTAFVKNAFDSDAIQTAQRNIDFGRPDGFAPARAFNAYLPTPRFFGMRVSTTLW